MSTTLKSTSGMLTVRELREFLDEHEKVWTGQDEMYLGSFDDQMILSLLPKSGYTFSKVVEAFEFGGFFVIPTDQRGNEINE